MCLGSFSIHLTSGFFKLDEILPVINIYCLEMEICC